MKSIVLISLLSLIVGCKSAVEPVGETPPAASVSTSASVCVDASTPDAVPEVSAEVAVDSGSLSDVKSDG